MADPQQWNRYAYVANDPVNAMDPLGLYIVRQEPNDSGGGFSWGGGWFPGWFPSPDDAIARFDRVTPGGGGGGGGNPSNKGGWKTDPKVAARTGWQYLTSIWKDCLDFFNRDARFDADNFAGLLTDPESGITWYDTRDKATGDRTVDSILHNGDGRTLSDLVGSRYGVVLAKLARHVALGQNWFQDYTQTQQVAGTIHEALHIQMGMGDDELKGWLRNFGFKPASYGTSDITDWISGGCK
jgi:hypothetical protein